MKTIDLEEIKNQVAVKHGYEMWSMLPLVIKANIVDKVAQEYDKQLAEQWCDETKEFGFGSYCNVEQKRYGASNEFYCYKVISIIKSNNWVDIPVDARVNKSVNHDTMEEVVICICMGVSEDTVTRFRLSDVIQSNTPNVVTKA